ncbi:MAG: Lrp/AsnC family transcriptional regulator [Flavobacteriaceae bacterium]
MTLDSIDKKLLGYLQQNSKQTTKELSVKLNLSVTAVYERVKKLERQKIIRQHTILLDKNKIGKGFTVFCHIKLKQHTKENIIDFEKEITLLNEVLECFHVSGDYDYIIKVCVSDMDEFREFMVTKFTVISSIGSTQSSFSISEVKNTTQIVL